MINLSSFENASILASKNIFAIILCFLDLKFNFMGLLCIKGISLYLLLLTLKFQIDASISTPTGHNLSNETTQLDLNQLDFKFLLDMEFLLELEFLLKLEFLLNLEFLLTA